MKTTHHIAFKNVACIITMLISVIPVFSQKIVEIAGRKFTITGQLQCTYVDNVLSGHVRDMECYIDLTKDSLFYYEVGSVAKIPEVITVAKVAIKDLNPQDSPFIFKTTFREKGKTFYELNVFTKDYKELVISIYQSKYGSDINHFGLINPCFNTEEEANDYNTKLLKLLK